MASLRVHATHCSMRGQGATEFLVLLGLVLVVSSVSVSLLSYFMGTTSDTQARISESYWVAAKPTGVYDAKTTEAACNSSRRGYTFTLENHEATPITLTGISVAGQNSSFCNTGQTAASSIRLETGQKTVIDVPANISSSSGKSISASIILNYTSYYGTAGAQYGTTPLVITNSLPPQANLGESCASLQCSSGYVCNDSQVCQQSISLAALAGVTVPVTAATPVSAITETAQYTGTVTWAPADNPFGGGTIYTATITITPKSGYTSTGVPANFFTVAGATSATNPANSGVVTAVFPATAVVLTIGMEYQGGKIVYLDGTGQHGLIMALDDQGTSIWGCYGTNIPGASGIAIGTGHQNTHDMIAAGCTDATQLVHGVTINGYDDWYLPSYDELTQVCVNLAAIGGFDGGWHPYWSSTERFNDMYGRITTQYTPCCVMIQRIPDCSSTPYNTNGKQDVSRVRAFRSF